MNVEEETKKEKKQKKGKGEKIKYAPTNHEPSDPRGHTRPRL